jgi:hypothetical protein
MPRLWQANLPQSSIFVFPLASAIPTMGPAVRRLLRVGPLARHDEQPYFERPSRPSDQLVLANAFDVGGGMQGHGFTPQRSLNGAMHRDIASRVGCSREMVSRLMKDLETGKFIAASGADTVILRPFPSGW